MRDTITIKAYLMLLLIFMGGSHLLGQINKYADSLLIETKYATGEDKLYLTKLFSRKFFKSLPKETFVLIDESLQQVDLSKLDSAEMHLLKGRASYYLSDFGEYSKNIKIAFDLIDSYQETKTPYFYFLRYYQNYLTASQKVHKGLPQEALKNYITALGDAEQSDDPQLIIQSYKSLASFFIDQEDYKLALTYFNKILNSGTKLEDAFAYKIYKELTSTYMHLNQLDSAGYYLGLIPKEKKDIAAKIICSQLRTKKGRPLEALKILNKQIATVKKEGPSHWLPYLQMIKSDNLLALKQFQEAQKLLLKARLTFLESNDKQNILRVNRRLYQYFKQRGQFEKALIYHEEYKRLNDSILYANYNTVLEGIKDKHALEIVEKEYGQLKVQASKKNLTIQRQQLIGGIGGIFLLLLGSLTGNFFRNAARKHKINLTLKQANIQLANEQETNKSRIDELNTIIKQIPTAVIRLNEDFTIQFFNEQFTTALGISNNLQSQNIFQVLKIRAEKRDQYQQEILANKGDSFVWTSVSTHKVYQVRIMRTDSSTQQENYVMIMEDITELTQRERARLLEVETSLKNIEANYQKSHEEKEQLSLSLATKNRELTTKVMEITKRSAELESIMTKLKQLQPQVSNKTKSELYKIIQQIHSTLNLEENWKIFTMCFNEMHPSFTKDLLNKHPDFSKNEVRHCVFLRLGFSNGEVANLLNVAPKTVEVARYRIKKKLNLSKEDKLDRFITQIA